MKLGQLLEIAAKNLLNGKKLEVENIDLGHGLSTVKIKTKEK